MDSPAKSWLNRIHQGDCVAGMHQLPPQSIDLAFADPPFNIGYDYDVYDDRQGGDEYLGWSRSWITAVRRVLRPNGAFWLAIGDDFAAELKLLSQEIGFHCRSWVVWYYTFGVNCSRKFTRSHAHLFHFVMDPQQFTFRESDSENRIPSARQLVYADSRANPRGRLPDDTWILRPQDLTDCFTPDEDTWYFPRVAGTFKERAGFHGCQMPEQLLGRIIRCCSHEDETILDPFAGSATTLAVAKKLGRNFVGFELSPDYAQRGVERVSRICRGDRLDGAPEPLVSAPATIRPREKRNKSRADAAQSAQTSDAAAERRQTDRIESLTDRGVVEAFRCSHQGYSVDRLVADPELNAVFVTACQTQSLAGDARSWNRRLFRLRKAGRLSDAVVDRRTEISWLDCDGYLFASEIALRSMLDLGWASVDEILCDPDASRQFDQRAASLAPGYKALEYRWAALRLRKGAKTARTRAAVLELPSRFGDSLAVTTNCWRKLPAEPGVYLVSAGQAGRQLYVGGALNLRDRMQRQFASVTLIDQWREWADELVIRTFSAPGDPVQLLGYQSLLVTRHDPLLNFQDLAQRA